jgi:hypothetical protein
VRDDPRSQSESRSRKVNEGIDAGRGLADVQRRLSFVCECGRLGCSEVIRLTIGEYERVRSSGRRFVVAPDHVDPEIDEVIEEAPDHVVVEKLGGAADRAEARDPRAERDA